MRESLKSVPSPTGVQLVMTAPCGMKQSPSRICGLAAVLASGVCGRDHGVEEWERDGGSGGTKERAAGDVFFCEEHFSGYSDLVKRTGWQPAAAAFGFG